MSLAYSIAYLSLVRCEQDQYMTLYLHNLFCLPECIALYTYNGQAGDLSFQEGDVISITKSDGDWWEGTLNGQKGIFPANYVKMKEAEVLQFIFHVSPLQLSLSKGVLISFSSNTYTNTMTTFSVLETTPTPHNIHINLHLPLKYILFSQVQRSSTKRPGKYFQL